MAAADGFMTDTELPPQLRDPPRAGYQRYLILALITLVFALSSGDRATLSVAGPGMAKSLGLSPVEMGWLFSGFAWAYVLAQLPGGRMVDLLGAKLSIFLSLTLWSLTTFATSGAGWYGSAFASVMLLRVLLGLFEAPVGPASGRVLAAWFPSTERGIGGSIFNSAQYLSLVIFTPFMGWLDHQFGWQHIFSVMGVLGVILALVWYRLYYAPANHPKLTQGEFNYIQAGGALVELGQPGEAVKVARRPLGADLRAIFKSRMLVGIFLAQYCISAITWFFVSWFPTYLVKGRGFTMLEASFIAALPAICGCIGGVSTGFFSDWLLGRTGSLSLARKIPITIGLALSALMIGCSFTDSGTLVIVLMCLSFFGKGFGSLGWTVVADTAPKEIVGLTGGVFNGLSNIAGITTPIVIGYLVSATGSFNDALIYVGAHGLIAILSFWLIVGRIERLHVDSI